MRRSKVDNRKGLFALESLLGLVLSVIALMILVKIFASAFLQTPTNEKIANYNGESIRDFIVYSSSGEYSEVSNCFNILKFINLENYQFEEEGGKKNYFYVIANDAVYVISQKYIGDFKSNPDDFRKFGGKKFSYGKDIGNINLFEDKTDQGLPISFELFFFVKVGYHDTNLDILDKLNKQLILIEPDYKTKIPMTGINANVLADNQNNYKIQIYDGSSFKEAGGDNFVFSRDYNNNKNMFFATEGKVSDIYIDSNLCSKIFLKDKDYNVIFKKNSGKDAPYTNKKIIFNVITNYVSGTNVDFIYELGKISCSDINGEVDCGSYFNSIAGISDYTKFTYSNFVDNINKVNENYWNIAIKNKDIPKAVYSPITPSIEDLSFDEVFNSNVKIEFKNVFDELSFDLSKVSKDEFEEKGVYSFDGVFKNKNINGCSRNECNYIVYNNGRVFNYIKTDLGKDKYYAFRSYFLVKKYDKVYLNGKEIEYELLDSDKFGVSFGGGDNKIFYLIKIRDVIDSEGNSQDYDVILSAYQFREEIRGVE